MQYVPHDDRSEESAALPTDAIPGALPLGFAHEPLRTVPATFLRGPGYGLLRASQSEVQGELVCMNGAASWFYPAWLFGIHQMRYSFLLDTVYVFIISCSGTKGKAKVRSNSCHGSVGRQFCAGAGRR